MKKIFVLLFILGINYLFAQSLSNHNYTLVERTDLRRYDNNKYKGLVSREVRSFISCSDKPIDLIDNENDYKNVSWYDGSFYIEEKIQRNLNSVATGIHDSIPSVFCIDNNGHMTMYIDNGYPSFRSFPSFPNKIPNPGDSWISTAERSVDPLNKGHFTKMPIQVEFTLVGEETYHEEPVFRIIARWATRYGLSYIDVDGDAELTKAYGSHKANILVSKNSLNALLVHDTVDEVFQYKDGSTVAFKGTISLFTEYPPAIPRDKIIDSLNRIASISNNSKVNDNGILNDSKNIPKSNKENDIVVENTKAGIRLSIQNLQFKADSAELLQGEDKRLTQIAEVLRLAPESQFLIEGHTASTGNFNGEMELSKQRAHSIAEALVQRGLPADKFICRGAGSTKPVADNSTTEGKAKNRRVEITILAP